MNDNTQTQTLAATLTLVEKQEPKKLVPKCTANIDTYVHNHSNVIANSYLDYIMILRNALPRSFIIWTSLSLSLSLSLTPSLFPLLLLYQSKLIYSSMDPILNGPMFVGAWTSLAIASIGVFSRANHICLFHGDMWSPPRWTPHAYAFVLLFLPLICSIRLLSSSTISFSFFLPHIGTHFGVDARACATRHRLGSGSVRRHRRCPT